MTRAARQRARIEVPPRKEEIVGLRYASSDLDLIEEAATSAGLLISDYIRRVSVAQAKADLGKAVP